VTPTGHEGIKALECLDLGGLRSVWQQQWGSPPTLRSEELLRLLLAWRLQAQVHGGLTREARQALSRRGTSRAEGLDLGAGAVLRREWKGSVVEVTVTSDGFLWQGRRYRSLSAVATAIAGTRWNGPRFFGLRERLR
jgi:hypothetical protein